MTTNKFNWLRAVYAADFSGAEKAVLAHVAMFSVLTGEDTFCVKQATIAEHCGMTRATVNTAISKAKRHGYLVLAEARKPGWGKHAADTLRLAVPESCQESLHDSVTDGANEASRVNGFDMTSNESCQDFDRVVSSVLIETCQESLQPYKEDSSLNSSRGRSADRPPPCPRHPNGFHHSEPCFQCMRIRLWEQQDQAEAEERERRERQRQAREIRQAIIECKICDDEGWEMLGDNTVRRCNHSNRNGQAVRHADKVVGE